MSDMKLKMYRNGQYLIIEWPKKNPKLDAEMYALGGVWFGFTSYRFPFNLGSIKKVYNAIKKYGTVTMTQSMSEEVARLREEHTRNINLGAKTNGDINDIVEREAPLISKSLKGYQKAGVEFLTSHRRSLLADHPGSGKTLMAITTMINADVRGDILVLAPSVAASVSWPEEFERWLPSEDEVYVVDGNHSRRESILTNLRFKNTRTKRRWFICNHEMARMKYYKNTYDDAFNARGFYKASWPHLFYIDYTETTPKNPRQWAAIIVDESHRCLVTKKSQVWRQQQVRCGLGKLQVTKNEKGEEVGYRIAMSGTPFRGKVENLWGTLNWLDPGNYKSLTRWQKYYFNAEQNYWGGSTLHALTDEKEEEMFMELSNYMIRRTKNEIMPELPPKSYAGHILRGIDVPPSLQQGLVGHWLKMTGKQAKAYGEMKASALAKLDSGELLANGVLAEMMRLKQFAGSYGSLNQREIDHDGFIEYQDYFTPALPSNKFTWLLEFLEERGIYKDTIANDIDDQKVVVASQFTGIINVFADSMEAKGIPSYRITGQTKNVDRREYVKEFQKDTGVQVMFVNTKAAGVALTLDRADELVVLDETFTPDDQEQVEDRIHRTSRLHKVIIHYVRSLGSIEEQIALTTINREVTQKSLLDGQRGVDFARQILQAK